MSLAIGIVGLPNVGKSTLFNRFINHKKSIVFDQDGVTRDYIEEIIGERNILGKKLDNLIKIIENINQVNIQINALLRIVSESINKKEKFMIN